MTLKEAIYDIREGLKILNIDSDMTDRQIQFLMRIYRSIVIRQHIINNPGEHRDMLTQTLYMPLELVPDNRFPEYSTSGFTVLRTTDKLPNIVGQQMYKEYEVRLDSLLGSEIEMVHKSRAANFLYAPVSFIYGFRDDNEYIYVVSKNTQYKNLTRLTVTAILEEPEDELKVHKDIVELERYPITTNLWGNVKDMVIQYVIREMSVPVDLLNDKRDEQLQSTGNTTKTQK
jgi:hypothetical protein